MEPNRTQMENLGDDLEKKNNRISLCLKSHWFCAI